MTSKVANDIPDFIENKLDYGKFKAFARYMIQAAEQKRCVPYYELENIFGLNHEYCGWYAGVLGELCLAWEWPLLNGLIISSTQCVPSKGFKEYADTRGQDWGTIVQKCWKEFHVTSSRPKQVQNFAGLDSEVQDFLDT